MKGSGLAMSGLLMMAMLVAGCDRGKPGNPMPPQKPPMPKTVGAIFSEGAMEPLPAVGCEAAPFYNDTAEA